MRKVLLGIGILSAVCALVVSLSFVNGNAGYASSMGETGRYQIYMHPEFLRATYLLDTETGRVWVCVVDKNERYLWEEMERVDFPPLSRFGGEEVK